MKTLRPDPFGFPDGPACEGFLEENKEHRPVNQLLGNVLGSIHYTKQVRVVGGMIFASALRSEGSACRE